ncbi:MAG: NADPH:quinone oxidoreductase family protein [Armatimonadetes bacterium]|nr:NADPH:quinone oxidoreductase family protein [Armatimonadota bacterium]
MKAIMLVAHGEPDQLVLREVPVPEIGADEVLIKVAAIGVNYADVSLRRGRYPTGGPPPIIPGMEVSGTIERVGSGVRGLAPGPRVMAMTRRFGGYAEYAKAVEADVIALPEWLTFEDGAAFPLVFLSAYHALFTFGHLQPGERVLINAAGGAVGTAAVQLAKLRGAHVIAAAGDDEKLARVKALGADDVINYRTSELSAEVERRTGKVDLVLESVGGKIFWDSLACLPPLGRMVVFGTASGEIPTLTTRDFSRRNLTIGGFSLPGLMDQREMSAAAASDLLMMLQRGKIRPVIGHRFPMEKAAEVHRLLEGRQTYGKIVMLP